MANDGLKMLQKYRNKIDSATKKAAKKLSKKSKNPSFGSYFIFKISNLLQCKEIVLPPAHIPADLSASAAATNEAAIKKIKALPSVRDVVLAGPFLNISLDRPLSYRDILFAVKGLGDQFGKSDGNKGGRSLIEYSSPNIAKPMSVGHLRSTIIGDALANIYESAGYNVLRDNYPGDWGTQFGYVLDALRDMDSSEREKWMAHPQATAELYQKRFKEGEHDPTIKDRARDAFRALEEGDPELIQLWTKLREMSIKEFEEVYVRLGIEFDVYSNEGFFADQGEDVITECLEKGVCKKDDATKAVIVDSLEGVPSFLLKKSDGSTLYLTRELAMLRFRKMRYKTDKILVVVGGEQSLHFRQLKALAKKMGYVRHDEEVEHINFGLVLAGGKKMSTRKGTTVELRDLLDQSVEKARNIVKEKNKDLSEKEIKQIAEMVGVGAVVYNDLKQARQTNISFDWGKMLDFERGSAAYLQYTHARIRSILRKVGKPKVSKSDIKFEENVEFEVARKIALFPQVIVRAQKSNAPNFVATYLEELTQLFNTFYSSISIAGTEDAKLKNSRLLLAESTAQVIKNGLRILNIQAPERM